MTELALYDIGNKLETIGDTIRDLRRDIGGSLAGHTEMVEQALRDCAALDAYRGGYWHCASDILFELGGGKRWEKAVNGCQLHLHNGMLRIFRPGLGEVTSVPVMSITRVSYALNARDF